jgi:hypothetical protein
MLEWLARYARLILIASALLLLAGVTLTGLNLLLLGWSAYAVGHLGAMFGLLANAAANRRAMDGWSWAGLLVVLIGLLLALPQVASIWSLYAQGGGLLPVAGREMELLVWTPPMGLTAELVTWVGFAFYGLAARGARALPAGIGWIFVGAAVIGLLAALYLITPLFWVLAMLLVALGLLGVGVSLPQADARTEPAA